MLLLLLLAVAEGIVGMFCWCDVQKKKRKGGGNGEKTDRPFPISTFQRAGTDPHLPHNNTATSSSFSLAEVRRCRADRCCSESLEEGGDDSVVTLIHSSYAFLQGHSARRFELEVPRGYAHPSEAALRYLVHHVIPLRSSFCCWLLSS
eukprot:scaffold7136_cov64-Skeletonema_dohrnii-CCMP3373.AAC.3